MNLVANCGQLSVTGSAQSQVLMSLGPCSDWAKHLRSVEHEFHGTVGLLRGHRCQNDVRPHLPLATKTTTHEERSHMNFIFWNTESLCERALHARNVLARVVQYKTVAIPLSNGGVGLHWVVVLDRSRVNLVDLNFSLAKSGIGITETHISWDVIVSAGVGRGKSSHKIQFGRRLVILGPN